MLDELSPFKVLPTIDTNIFGKMRKINITLWRNCRGGTDCHVKKLFVQKTSMEQKMTLKRAYKALQIETNGPNRQIGNCHLKANWVTNATKTTRVGIRKRSPKIKSLDTNLKRLGKRLKWGKILLRVHNVNFSRTYIIYDSTNPRTKYNN